MNTRRKFILPKLEEVSIENKANSPEKKNTMQHIRPAAETSPQLQNNLNSIFTMKDNMSSGRGMKTENDYGSGNKPSDPNHNAITNQNRNTINTTGHNNNLNPNSDNVSYADFNELTIQNFKNKTNYEDNDTPSVETTQINPENIIKDKKFLETLKSTISNMRSNVELKKDEVEKSKRIEELSEKFNLLERERNFMKKQFEAKEQIYQDKIKYLENQLLDSSDLEFLYKRNKELENQVLNLNTYIKTLNDKHNDDMRGFNNLVSDIKLSKEKLNSEVLQMEILKKQIDNGIQSDEDELIEISDRQLSNVKSSVFPAFTSQDFITKVRYFEK